MKHVKVMSSEKPARAAQVAWVDLKNIIGIPIFGFDLSRPLTNARADWLLGQINDGLNK